MNKQWQHFLHLRKIQNATGSRIFSLKQQKWLNKWYLVPSFSENYKEEIELDLLQLSVHDCYQWWSDYDSIRGRESRLERNVLMWHCLEILETKGGMSFVNNIWAWTNTSSDLGEETRTVHFCFMKSYISL